MFISFFFLEKYFFRLEFIMGIMKDEAKVVPVFTTMTNSADGKATKVTFDLSSFFTNQIDTRQEILINFLIVWCDYHLHKTLYGVTPDQFRNISTCYRNLDSIDRCTHGISSRRSEKKLVFIITHSWRRKIVFSVDDLQKHLLVDVYNMDKDENKQYTMPYKKVRLT